jgi:mannose-1-phosphate guanylyltransferase
MAGGSGTRFWPLSRELSPKQLLNIVGDSSLLSNTVARLQGLIPNERIIIVTNDNQVELLKKHLPNEILESNILTEPTPRNTAPCIGLAAFHVQRLDPEAVMLVLPSDHMINNVDDFQDVIRTSVAVVNRKNPLVTIGIPPLRPETGYGYIQFETSSEDDNGIVHPVKTFAEKPNYETAVRFVDAGDFYWNSGIFVWKSSRILAEIEEHLSDQYLHLKEIDSHVGCSSYEDVLADRYHRMRPISIDYGVMEVSRTPKFMVSGNFGWSDVGSWDEIYRLYAHDSNGHAERGNAVQFDTKNNLIYSEEKLTAVIGLNDILVVNTPDATLICPLSKAQEVKEIVEKLRKEGRKEYL